MSEVAVVATIIAKPGMEDALFEQLGTIIGPTRVEQGALQYDLHRDRDDPRRFVFFERWKSDAALAAHRQAAHMLAYRQNAAGLIESVEVRVMQRVA
ncbi:putative quinol monooxygenase [Burkholderia glumae]|uniref:putative quinol monooxygenase n=1 Tax=Burkholderia glumae TaxID=337 RepID=UPI00215142CD|nr:putative quinol monooxygenase [Burkholderia glumae]UVS95699.1 antibiotic biosynthesis monooxygenase [Burkholderia glumae]